jgi:hypothetical protein
MSLKYLKVRESRVNHVNYTKKQNNGSGGLEKVEDYGH